MQIAQLTLTDAFKVLFSVRQVQAAEMAIAPGQGEGGPDNRHRGADQWLYVVDGTGEAVIEGQTHALQAG
ncbi:cupin domain-containing protein, partial [Xanthomonas perforans]